MPHVKAQKRKCTQLAIRLSIWKITVDMNQHKFAQFCVINVKNRRRSWHSRGYNKMKGKIISRCKACLFQARLIMRTIRNRLPILGALIASCEKRYMFLIRVCCDKRQHKIKHSNGCLVGRQTAQSDKISTGPNPTGHNRGHNSPWTQSRMFGRI